MYGTLQARHTATPLTRLVACLHMGQGCVEDPCRRSTCQEIFGDLTSKRDTLCQLNNTAVKGTYF